MSYIAKKFNNLMPIVFDVETGGVNNTTDALLEIAAICINYSQQNKWHVASKQIWHEHIIPFAGGQCHPEALNCNKIIPDHPLRFAIDENAALISLRKQIHQWLLESSCKRGVLVGHNAHFDLNFIMKAVERCSMKHFPLHSFTCFDTATLGGVLYGKTVLAQIMQKAKVRFDVAKAHGALYDAKKTAELFCQMLNLIDEKIIKL